MEENREKSSNPKTDWHDDSLAYLRQKSQLHHVSKVNLKQWHQGSKNFSLSSLIHGFGQYVSSGIVESECNNACVVFTG